MLCRVQYTAVPQMDGAPLRAITVKDAIGDLPPIINGSDMLEMAYSGVRLPTLPHSLQACHGTEPVLRTQVSSIESPLLLQRICM